MKITRERKVLIGLMGAGLLALAGDRVFFASPSTSSAATTPAPAARTAPTASATQAVQETTPGANLSDRLQQAARVYGSLQSTGQRLFSGESSAGRPQPATAVAAEQFADAHRLSGVISSGGRGQAIVDGRVVKIGQAIEGFTLVSVGKSSATFARGEARVTLTLSERGL